MRFLTLFLATCSLLIVQHSAIAQSNPDSTPTTGSKGSDIVENLKAYFSGSAFSRKNKKYGRYKLELNSDGSFQSPSSGLKGRWWVISTGKLCLEDGAFWGGRWPNNGGATRCYLVKKLAGRSFRLIWPDGRGWTHRFDRFGPNTRLHAVSSVEPTVANAKGAFISKARGRQGQPLTATQIRELFLGNTLVYRRNRHFHKNASIRAVSHDKLGKFERGWSVSDGGIYCMETHSRGKSCRKNVIVEVSGSRVMVKMTMMSGRRQGKVVRGRLAPGNQLR